MHNGKDRRDDIIMPATNSSPCSSAVTQARCHPCAEEAKIAGDCYLLSPTQASPAGCSVLELNCVANSPWSGCLGLLGFFVPSVAYSK